MNRSFTRIAVAAEPGEVVSEQLARVQANIAGRGVGSAVLHLREEGGDWREVAMHAGSAQRFDAVIASVPRPLEFFVTAGDGRSPVARVACHIPAKLEAVSARLVFPEYTGLAPVEKKSGDIEAVEDTQAGLDFVFNRAIAEARVVFSDETSVPVAVEAASGHALVVVGKKDLKWRIAGKDSAGLAFESPQFRLKGIADKLPEIKLLEPRDEIEVTPLHELLARFRARDDFGLAKVGVVLKVGSKTEPLFEKEFAAHDVKDAAEMATAFLEKYPLTINDNVQVYAYATDHKPRGGARAITPLVNVDIREYQRRYVFSDGGECKCVNVLEQLISQQRRVLSDTAQFAEMSAGQDLSAGLVAPLAARERKVAAATDELIGKLGDIPAFVQGGEAQLAEDAQQQMQAAADSLDALALAPAAESENDALSTLLKLRREMIKKLGKSKNGGRVTNKNPNNDGPIPLGDIAQRIERAAEAEKNIAAETRALGAQAAPAPLLRAQDVAVGDAGEALSELDAHVAATELLRTRGAQAEGEMHAAGDLLNAKPAEAPAALTTAEGTLRELAGHLRLLAGGSTEEMLQQLEARADEAAHCLGECAACQKSGGGKSGTQVSPERVSELAEKAATLDDALRQWSENADQDDAGKGARLGALREQEATGKLPGELRALAAQIAKPGDAADAAEKAEALAARHREIAAKLAGERDQSRRVRAERLTELRESLKPFLSFAPARAGQRGGNGRGLPLSAAAMQDWQGAGGKVVLAELLGVGDEKLTSMAENLATMREQKILYPGSIEQVDARLAALLAALQRGNVAAVREIAVPGAYRRVVENYFRALSDDFGDEKWDAAKGE